VSGRSGRCLCGAVRYVVNGPLRDVIVCHCVECRRWAGGAWPATAVHREQLELRGEADVRWEPSPDSATSARRGTCAVCGSSMFWEAPGRATVSIGAGTLDDATGLELAAHIYVADAQGWEPVRDVPAHAGGYPETAPAPVWR
jgi:hypothetical protein